MQTYDLRRGLNLVFLTAPQTPDEITATCAWKDVVFAAWGGKRRGSGIWSFRRGKKVEELDVPEDLDEPILNLMVFGSWIVGCCRNRIEVWRSTTFEHYTTLQPSRGGQQGGVLSGGVCSLPTFLNKIFVGRLDGGVEIWNLNTGYVQSYAAD